MRGKKKKPRYWQGMEIDINGIKCRVVSITANPIRGKHNKRMPDILFLEKYIDWSWQDHGWVSLEKIENFLDF